MPTPITGEEVLVPDAIMPEQFLALWSNHAETPERALALCVLEQAALDLRTHCNARNRRARRLYWDAHNWVLSRDRSHPFSFLNLCEALGLSPSAIRHKLFDEPTTRRDLGEAA